jgi:hypothetical protein
MSDEPINANLNNLKIQSALVIRHIIVASGIKQQERTEKQLWNMLFINEQGYCQTDFLQSDKE